MLVPGTSSVTIADRVHRLFPEPFLRGAMAQIDSGQSDATNTPTWRIRKGTVLAYRTSTKKYILSDDANADTMTPATVSTATGISAAWANSTFTFTLDQGVSFNVVMVTATTTNAAVVTALNANAVFAANCVADVNASAVRIRTLRGGASTSLKASSTVASSFGASITSASAIGTDPKILVTEEDCDLQDPISGAAVDAVVSTCRVGHFDSTVLLHSTPQALEVLRRNGSFLD